MNEDSKEQEYSKIGHRINILGFVVFIGITAAFILTATQVFNVAWTEWWVGIGGLLIGFAIALAVSVLVDFVVGRKYELISLSL